MAETQQTDRGWTFFFEFGWPLLWRPYVGRSGRVLRFAWLCFSLGVVKAPASAAFAFCMYEDK